MALGIFLVWVAITALLARRAYLDVRDIETSRREHVAALQARIQELEARLRGDK